MQENNDLKFKTLQIANYLVNRFNQDIKNETFKLVVEEAYHKNGYKICFVNKKIYYDIHLLPEYENGKNKVCILGTYYFYLLDEKKTKKDYYLFFLEIVNSLFKKQWENLNVYGTAPQCIHEVNQLINTI